MKGRYLYTVILLLAIVTMALWFKAILHSDDNSLSEIELLRLKHLEAIEKLTYPSSQLLSKTERQALRLPPNKYFEDLWMLTLDPKTGRPMPENLVKIKSELKATRSLLRGVGDVVNPWVDRGPNNVGGRTRAVMFDPNDVSDPPSGNDFKRVFAGSVSGGLWVNEDITDPASNWTQVDGMNNAFSVSVMIYDPNDTQTFYIGTGESYTYGRAVGNGIWKSVDAGTTWQKVFGGYEGITGNNVEGIFYINDLVARDNSGVTELYASVATSLYRSANSPRQTMSAESLGVYRSVDGGLNWQRLEIKTEGGDYENPNDIEIDINNNIWVTTTENLNRVGGGDIFKSTDGINFTRINTIPNARRTELEISSNDPNLMWVAVNVDEKGDLYKSTDGFATYTKMNEPNDADGNIPADDFTRGQAFYDLEIESDSNDNLIVGGIDLFRSTDGGSSWTQISKWQNNSDLGPLAIPLVHPDQHAIIFRPGSDTEMVFSNDGGVYYSEDVTLAASSESAITERNKDYNTVQFYYGTMDISTIVEDNFAGGTQDNGTPLVINANSGTNAFVDYFEGDGAFTEIDGEEGYMLQSYYYNDHTYIKYPEFNLGYRISTLYTDGNLNGNFINVAELDRNLNILYSNASYSSNYRIEKISNFINGKDNIESSFLSHPDFNATPSAFKVSPFTLDATDLLVGTITGRLFKVLITEGSAVWTEITGSNFVGSISDIEFGQNELEIFVTFHNYGVQSIWLTIDGGLSWRSLEGDLPDLPVKCILQNPLDTDELIIGTELGVWRTQDYTQNLPIWTHAYNGMSDVTVVDIDLRPADNMLLASTYGRGLFTSQFTDNSLSLKEFNYENDKINIIPTVSRGRFSLISKKALGNVEIRVFDVNGKQYFSDEMFIDQSNTELFLNLKPNLYFVTIRSENDIQTKRIIIN